MRSCIKRLHQELNSGEILRIVLTGDYELTVKPTDKVTSGSLIIIIRTNGRKVVVNPSQVIFACTQEASL